MEKFIGSSSVLQQPYCKEELVRGLVGVETAGELIERAFDKFSKNMHLCDCTSWTLVRIVGLITKKQIALLLNTQSAAPYLDSTRSSDVHERHSK